MLGKCVINMKKIRKEKHTLLTIEFIIMFILLLRKKIHGFEGVIFFKFGLFFINFHGI